MAIKRKTHPYYKFDKVLSYNATINIIPGGRGIGKTYGFLKMAISHFIERGEEFIYLRRFEKEIKMARPTMLTAVSVEFPDWDLRVNGHNLEIAHSSTRDEQKREWKIMGYTLALSTAQGTKGIDYHNVTKICFDEFIKEKAGGAHYLTNEAHSLINFYMTVDRWHDKTKVFLLANAVGIDNPYFIEWNIEPEKADKNGILRLDKQDDGSYFVVCHFPDSEEFKNSVYETKLGKWLKGTQMAEFAVENKFPDNNLSLVETKDPQAQYIFTLHTDKGEFSVWHNPFTDEMYAQAKLPKQQRRYTLDSTRVTRDRQFLAYSDPKATVMRSLFRKGQMTFDHPRTRNAFMEVFKR